MKALVAYDTKYGTTKTIAQWVAEGIGVDCDIKNVSEIESCDYDFTRSSIGYRIGCRKEKSSPRISVGRRGLQENLRVRGG